MTSAQLSLAWVSSLGANIVPIPGSSKATRVKENFAAAKIAFSDEELKEINDVLEKHPVKGGRYTPAAEKQLWG